MYLVNDISSSTSCQYALKKILIQSKEQFKDAHAELSSLQMFSGNNHHPNIIELIDSGVLNNRPASSSSQIYEELYLLFPYYPLGTAWDSIERANPHQSEGPAWPFDEHMALHIIVNVCYGLMTLHDRGYAHRDVKPHNILLGSDGIPVLTDLGSMAASRIEVHTRQEALMVLDEASVKVSAPYRAPELTEINTLPKIVSLYLIYIRHTPRLI